MPLQGFYLLLDCSLLTTFVGHCYKPSLLEGSIGKCTNPQFLSGKTYNSQKCTHELN